jgi:hypothetical protein
LAYFATVVLKEISSRLLTAGQMDAVYVEKKLQRIEPACTTVGRLCAVREWALMNRSARINLHLTDILVFGVQAARLSWRLARVAEARS